MELRDRIVFSTELMFQLIMLIAIWNWSAQRKIMLALLGASTLVLVPAAISLMFPVSIPTRAYLAFAGMYIFCRLLWRWWKDGIAPDQWRVSEIALAVLATTMFSLASVALDPTA